MTRAFAGAIIVVLGRLGFRGRVLSTLAFVKALRARDIDARVVAAGGPLARRFAEANIPLTLSDVLDSPFPDPFRLRQLAHLLADPAPSLLHLMEPAILGRTLRLARRLRVPTIATFHDPEPQGRPIRNTSALAGIVAVSEAVRESLVNDRKVPKERIRIIPSGVWPDDYSHPCPRRSPGPTTTLGALGPLVPHRGHEFLLRATRLLRDRGRETLLILGGEGPAEEDLKALGRSLAILSAITFSPQVVASAEIADAVDVIVSPALREGLGQTLIEAMACGAPVVATDVGGVYQVVQDEQTGLVIPPRDPIAIANAVERLVTTPGLPARLGATGRAYVLGDFDISKAVDLTLSLYEEVAGPPSRT